MRTRRIMCWALFMVTIFVGTNIAAHFAIARLGPCNSYCVPTEADPLVANRIVWTLIADIYKACEDGTC